MKLYLLRHATASDIAPSDAARALTPLGEEEARIAGAALLKLGGQPAHVFSSPLLRARQTAALVAGKDVETLDELLNDVPTATLLKALKPHAAADEILLVGHMPSLSEHMATLIGAKTAGGLAMGKAGLACVELDELRAGHGQLRWLMRQDQLRQLVR